MPYQTGHLMTGFGVKLTRRHLLSDSTRHMRLGVGIRPVLPLLQCLVRSTHAARSNVASPVVGGKVALPTPS
jgi:hypothetical protein